MKKSSGFMDWIDARFPATKMWNEHLAHYYAPKNFNFWYFFGSLALLVLVNQLLTGIWLAMFYKPAAAEAFGSVEYIMRDVSQGWILRYLHSTGASFFFIVVYLHMFRGLLYGSYRKPRELVWLIGCAIYVCLLAEAFMGYLLPWGQMSFWGAKVITSLFEAIPFVGSIVVEWLRGDFTVSDATLNRFYALHIVGIPLLFLLLIWMHIIALHEVGSNNPDGIEIKTKKDQQGKPLDGIPFHPYYTVKDIFGAGVFLVIFAAVVFFAPDLGGFFLEGPNFEPANPLKTPEHIAPVWYMTPFYAILRAIPHKLSGVIAMFSAVLIIFFLPWLDRSPVKSIRYRSPIYKLILTIFVISFISLGYLGLKPPSPERMLAAQIFSTLYFAFFITMPIYSKWGKTKPVPERVT
ncbi:MAG: cytochrome bc complex cytochrome b subunit [Candidatus Berkiellales bacterium]